MGAANEALIQSTQPGPVTETSSSSQGNTDPRSPAWRVVRRVERRMRALVYTGELCRHLALALFVSGAAFLLGRLLLDLDRFDAAVCFLLAVPAFYTAHRGARRRYLRADTIGAWLDLRAGASGRIVTGLECPDAASQVAMHQLLQQGGDRLTRLPKVRWGQFVAPLLPAVLFTALALWAPVTPAALGMPARDMFDSSLRQAAEKLAALEEALELEEDVAAELQDRLERLQDQASTEHPESTFEALDRFAQQLEAEAARAEEAAVAALERLASEDFRQAFHDGVAEELLEETLQNLTAAGFDKHLPDALEGLLGGQHLQLAEGLSLEPMALEGLSEELLSMLGSRLGELADAGLLQPGELSSGKDWKPARLCRDHDPGGT